MSESSINTSWLHLCPADWISFNFNIWVHLMSHKIWVTIEYNKPSILPHNGSFYWLIYWAIYLAIFYCSDWITIKMMDSDWPNLNRILIGSVHGWIILFASTVEVVVVVVIAVVVVRGPYIARIPWKSHQIEFFVGRVNRTVVLTKYWYEPWMSSFGMWNFFVLWCW